MNNTIVEMLKRVLQTYGTGTSLTAEELREISRVITYLRDGKHVVVDGHRLDKVIARVNCGNCPYSECKVPLTDECPLIDYLQRKEKS